MSERERGGREEGRERERERKRERERERERERKKGREDVREGEGGRERREREEGGEGGAGGGKRASERNMRMGTCVHAHFSQRERAFALLRAPSAQSSVPGEYMSTCAVSGSSSFCTA